MISSLIIVFFFSLGIVLGMFSLIPNLLNDSRLSEFALYLLMFLVGISIGGDPKTWSTLRRADIKILLVPLTVVFGSLLGTAFLSLFIKDISVREAMAVGSGFGYSSLTSLMITKFHSETLGTVALLSNLIREVFTLLATPFLAKYFGKLAPITSGGATSMDTTLPIIIRYSGKEYALISMFNGIVLTIIVPFMVTFFISR